MSRNYATEPHRTVTYGICRGICHVLFPFLYPLRVRGRENLRFIKPGSIVIANHKTFLDPVAIAVCVPRLQLHFVAKQELSHFPPLRWLFHHLHCISISRGATDLTAVRTCMTALKNQCILGIFPEGTRHQSELMQHVENGTAMIALRSGAPVIPVYIAPKLRLFHRTVITFGTPMKTDDLKENGINVDTLNAFSDRVRDTFYAMRDDFDASRAKK